MIRKIGSIAALAILLTSCGSTSRLYSWHGYDRVSYNVAKSPTPEHLKALELTYEKLINSPAGIRNTPPPGICAEYGYMLYKQGKQAEGIKLMEKEIALYPESKLFIGNMIKQLKK
jgi:hypothetical protein